MSDKSKPLMKIFIAIVVIFSIVILVYFISSASVEADKIVELYTSVSEGVQASGSNFDRPLLYLVHKKDGSVEVTFTLTSEYLQEYQDEIEQIEEVVPGQGVTLELSADAQAVKDALVGYYPDKADAMAMVYELINPILGTNAAIGLMANVVAEGDHGIVEYGFSRNHDHGFQLPSGGVKVSSVSDLNYLKQWDSTDTEKHGYSTKKGSCGVGAIQWSFGRRVNLINHYELYIVSDSDVTDSNLALGEAAMMSAEMSPGTSYYNQVSRNISSDTVTCWAEAFCDFYILPSGCCGGSNKMSGSGTACQARMLAAQDIARILGGL